MFLPRRQAQLVTNQFNNLNTNQQVHMAAPINHVLSTFEVNINHLYPKGLKPYPQETKEIDKDD